MSGTEEERVGNTLGWEEVLADTILYTSVEQYARMAIRTPKLVGLQQGQMLGGKSRCGGRQTNIS